MDNVIYKKLFYEKADLSAADKKLFTEGIDKSGMAEVADGDAAWALLVQRQATEAKISTPRAELKKETQFNRKVELNIEIKRLEREM